MNHIFRNIDGFEIIYPNVVGAEVSEDIVFTTRAMNEVVKELNNNYKFTDSTKNREVYFVRLKVLTSPSFAKRYSIEFDNKLEDIDRVFELRKVKIVIDRKSLFYFMGILIDYVDTDNGAGFIFYEQTDDNINEYISEYLSYNDLTNNPVSLRILIASNNKHKVDEINAIAKEIITNIKVQFFTPDSMGIQLNPEEPFETFEENAKAKAIEFYNVANIPTLADDTGLEIEALQWMPGVHSARFAEEHNDAANRAKVLDMLNGIDNRNARFRNVIAYYDGADVDYFEGICEGKIIDSERGENGFGYDPIFVPNGYNTTFAEMSSEEKNAISHRSMAVRAFCEAINNRYK